MRLSTLARSAWRMLDESSLSVTLTVINCLSPHTHPIKRSQFNYLCSLDVVTLGSGQNILHIYTWSHSLYQFTKNSTLQSPHGRRIVNVVPGDFTHSGRLDLLLMTDGILPKLESWLYQGLDNGFGMICLLPRFAIIKFMQMMVPLFLSHRVHPHIQFYSIITATCVST
jgi:hypothetical protein